MAVGKSSLQRANQGLNARKTIDKKAVLENVIVDVAISSLKAHEANACNTLKKSLETYGLICPIVAVKTDESLTVIDGAKRVATLKAMGVESVKVVVVNGNAKDLEKQLKQFNKQPKVEKERDIHEEKFDMISGITTCLPTWML